MQVKVLEIFSYNKSLFENKISRYLKLGGFKNFLPKRKRTCYLWLVSYRGSFKVFKCCPYLPLIWCCNFPICLCPINGSEEIYIKIISPQAKSSVGQFSLSFSLGNIFCFRLSLCQRQFSPTNPQENMHSKVVSPKYIGTRSTTVYVFR